MITEADRAAEKLLPCPFCGGDAHWSPTYVDQDFPGTASCANGCGAVVIVSGNKAQRIAAWNRRHREASTAALTAENQRLRAYHRDISKTALASEARRLANLALSTPSEVREPEAIGGGEAALDRMHRWLIEEAEIQEVGDLNDLHIDGDTWEHVFAPALATLAKHGGAEA